MKLFLKINVLILAALMVTACGSDQTAAPTEAPSVESVELNESMADEAADTLDGVAEEAKAAVVEAVEVVEEAVGDAKNELMASQSKEDMDEALDNAKQNMESMINK